METKNAVKKVFYFVVRFFLSFVSKREIFSSTFRIIMFLCVFCVVMIRNGNDAAFSEKVCNNVAFLWCLCVRYARNMPKNENLITRHSHTKWRKTKFVSRRMCKWRINWLCTFALLPFISSRSALFLSYIKRRCYTATIRVSCLKHANFAFVSVSSFNSFFSSFSHFIPIWCWVRVFHVV